VVDRQEIPERPSEEGCDVEDSLWWVWVNCWKTDPFGRLTAGGVVRILETIGSQRELDLRLLRMLMR